MGLIIDGKLVNIVIQLNHNCWNTKTSQIGIDGINVLTLGITRMNHWDKWENNLKGLQNKSSESVTMVS